MNSSSLPAVVDAFEFLGNALEKPPELIEGILHRGSKLVLGGASKSYKTWTLLDLACSVATGSPWLGFETQKGKVLFVNLEIQAPFIQNRVYEVLAAKNIAIKNGDLDLWNLRGHVTDTASLYEKLIEQANSQYSLIVLDPVYKLLFDSDENSANQIAILLNGLEKVAVQSGAAIAIAAHYSKGNQSQKEAIDRISGSGVFARDPDSMVVLTRHQEEDAFTIDFVLRNFPPQESFAVRRVHPLMQRDEGLDPTQLKTAAGRKPQHQASDLLALLTKPLENKEWLTAAEADGISSRSFYRLRKELESKRLIQKIGGKWSRT